MLRACANTPARRFTLLGVLLSVALVAAVGLAWACVPTARTAVSPISGAAGTQVTMTGDGFPEAAVKVDIYVDVKDDAHRVKDDLPMTTANNGEKAFSTQVTMPSTPGAHLLIPVPLDASNTDVGTVSSGAGPPAAVFQVTDPALTAAPGSGLPGTKVTVTGSHFRSGSVTLHWDSASGPQLGTATATGGNFGFAKQVTIPTAAAGNHSIVGVPFGDPSDTASTSFRVLAPPTARPIPGDSVGPAIVAAALSSQNGTRPVSRTGAVTLICGRFDEAGVTGACGARSVKKLKLASASKSALLKLRNKSFSARPGVPVKVKFRLSKNAMKMLKRARRVRMRGTVSARDSKGNVTPAVTFGFKLKAPKTRR